MQITFPSSRLRMRPILISDLEPIHGLLRLPETDRFNALGIPEGISETRSNVSQWIQDAESSNQFTLAIELETDNSLIGLLGLKVSYPKYRRAEIWYKLHPKNWGQGFATEAAQAAVRYGFDELDLHRIEAGVAVENLASIRVLEKVGMTREGRTRKSLPLKTGFSDTFLYAILKDDLPA